MMLFVIENANILAANVFFKNGENVLKQFYTMHDVIRKQGNNHKLNCNHEFGLVPNEKETVKGFERSSQKEKSTDEQNIVKCKYILKM